MRILISIFILAILGISTAYAKIPSEVMKPYKAYSTALKAGDKDEIKRTAKLSWQQAETHMGDHKTTGDLAQNYADALSDLYSKDRRKAYLRSVELALLHTDSALEIQLERQIKMAEMGFYFQFEGRQYFRKDINLASRLVKKGGFTGSVYDGEVETLNALNLYNIGKIDKAIRQIDTALDIFSKAPDVGISIYPYVAKLFKADFLKLDKQNIAALLQYQSVMQNVKGKLPSKHPFVARAFRKWISLRFEIEENGRLAEAEAAGMCECWPFEDYQNQLQPLRRFPPKMPTDVQRSGHVIVKFDVNDAGKITKIEVVSSTSRTFESPSIISVRKWIFSPKREGEKDGIRNGIITKISFKLTDESGRLIPEPQ